MSQKDDYSKKLYELERAKMKADADSYDLFIKILKWCAIGFVVFVCGGGLLLSLFGSLMSH